MIGTWALFALAGVAALAIILIAWRPIRGAVREARFAQDRRDFHRQRERLEARYLHLAANSGRAPHLRWSDCEFSNDVTYARDKRSGRLCAFVAVTIACDQPASGGLLDLSLEEFGAVANVRAATAVFHYEKGRWHTLGRTVFHLSPDEALARYKDVFVPLGQELARQR